MAKTTVRPIPAEVKEDLIGLGILQRQARQYQCAVERVQNRIIEKLIGAKVDNALLAELLAEHNSKAVRG